MPKSAHRRRKGRLPPFVSGASIIWPEICCCMLLLVGVLESALEPTARRINDTTAFIILCVMTYSVDTVFTNPTKRFMVAFIVAFNDVMGVEW